MHFFLAMFLSDSLLMLLLLLCDASISFLCDATTTTTTTKRLQTTTSCCLAIQLALTRKKVRLFMDVRTNEPLCGVWTAISNTRDGVYCTVWIDRLID